MNKCYYCEKKLVSKDEFNQKNLDTKTYTITHEEHIIQNAIGGFLKSSDILCEKCGGQLNDKIDVKFISIFKNLCNNLKIIIERDTKPKNFTKGTFTFYNKNITINTNFYREQWMIHKSDFFFLEEQNKILLILNKSTKREYIIKKIESDPRYNPNYAIIEINDLQNLEGFISSEFKLTNEAFKLGMAKIAIGYASYLQLDKSNLNNVLQNKNFKEIIFLPYYVNSDEQRNFESSFEPAFSPYHILYIFNIKTMNEHHLICYIDLLSTFKGFIILNNDYKGREINELYYRKTTNLNNQENNWLNQFKEIKFIEDYKKMIKKSYTDINIFIDSEQRKIEYLNSVKHSNHYYFYRLTSYISLLNMDKDYIKL